MNRWMVLIMIVAAAAFPSPALAQTDTSHLQGKTIGGVMVPTGATKADVLRLIDSAAIRVSDTSDALWPLYYKGIDGRFLGTVAFDNAGLVSRIDPLTGKDIVYARSGVDSSSVRCILRIIVNPVTTRYKDPSLFQDRDIGMLSGILNGTLRSGKAEYGFMMAGSMFSNKTMPGVKYDSLIGSHGDMMEFTMGASIGRRLAAPQGTIVPYIGSGFSYYGIPAAKDTAGMRKITGRRDVMFGLLILGVKSQWFGRRLCVEYSYTNTFPLPHSITATVYPKRYVGMAVGYHAGTKGAKGIGCSIVLGE